MQCATPMSGTVLRAERAAFRAARPRGAARRCAVTPLNSVGLKKGLKEVPLPSLTAEQIRDRAKGAVLGALVADAASMGLHWNYDQSGVLRMVKGDKGNFFDTLKGFVAPDRTPLELDTLKAEFYDPPSNMFYKYNQGEQSPYGDEAVALVRSMAKEGGSLVPEKYAEDSAAYYKAYKGRLNSLSKKYLENWDAGMRWPSCGVKGDAQAHSLVRVPAIVARYAGKSELNDQVTDAVRVHQDDYTAIDYATAFACILERVVLGATVQDAVKWAGFQKSPPLYDDQRLKIQDALGDIDKDPRDVVNKHGISCNLPGPFAGPLAICFTNGNSPNAFERAVRANILGGGDNCSRAAVVGSLMGAQGGVAGIPAEWVAKTNNWKEFEEAAEKIVAAAGY